ncbi:MAG TPA: PEGA domain-containing protein, partial [Kofleriaceae bacterium]|nr:PEGA domain-containing protein [Kofleriaceae bacterium]
SAGAGSARAGSAGAGSAATSGGAGTGAGSGAGSGSAAKAPASAKLTIESVPSGAGVFAIDGAFLGKTPLKLEWPVSEVPRTFELRLPGYHRRTRELVVSGNTTVRIELDRMPVTPPSRPSGAGSGQSPKGSNSDSGLMRPE